MEKKFFLIKKSLRKIVRLLFLLVAREGYLWLRNFWGVWVHPYLTLRRIRKTRDLSQEVLILGLPWGVWLGWILVLLVSRFFIFGKLQFGWWARVSFWGVSAFCVGIFLFLVYWWKEVEKNGREN